MYYDYIKKKSISKKKKNLAFYFFIFNICMYIYVALLLSSKRADYMFVI